MPHACRSELPAICDSHCKREIFCNTCSKRGKINKIKIRKQTLYQIDNLLCARSSEHRTSNPRVGNSISPSAPRSPSPRKPHDPADLIDREAAAWGRGCRCSHDRGEDGSHGANAMRLVLALGLLIALCASANAARVHHSKPRHVIVHPGFRPGPVVDPRFPPSSKTRRRATMIRPSLAAPHDAELAPPSPSGSSRSARRIHDLQADQSLIGRGVATTDRRTARKS